MPKTVRNPIEWGWAQLVNAGHSITASYRALQHVQETMHSPAPSVRRITVADLKDAFARGWEDFGTCRSDVIFLCALYPILGFVLGWLAIGHNWLPLVFPLVSGFSLIGPFVAVGLYEISRKREQGLPVNWASALDVARSPAFGSIVVLGLILMAIFLLWFGAAWAIYALTLGPEPPASVSTFVRDVFMTEAGWTMIVVGVGVGFLFALLAMSVSVASFPLLLDRDAGLDTAIATSIRAVAANPIPMALWGLIVGSGLLIGSLPLFVGLVVIVPLFGHTTWHLYRKLVEP